MCGIFAIYNPNPSTPIKLDQIILGANANQHRGQQGAGIAALQASGKLYHHCGNGLIKNVVTPNLLEKITPYLHWVMVQSRWTTYGSYQTNNLQPIVTQSKHNEKITIMHNGQFIVDPVLQQFENGYGHANESPSDSLLFSRLLNNCPGDSWDERVMNSINQVRGAFSLVIGINEDIYVCKDPLGLRSLVIGKKDDLVLISSETHAIEKLGGTIIKHVEAGEILKCTSQGLTILRKPVPQKRHMCDFEYAYIQRPDSYSDILNQSNGLIRMNVGRQIALEHPIHNADFVVGVPDSGVFTAQGYAHALGIPYLGTILRERDISIRLFMDDEKLDEILDKVLMKLSFLTDQEFWKDKRVVVGDDSLVRGNVARAVTLLLKKLGVLEIHWIFGFPWIKHPCPFGVNTQSYEELCAAQFEQNIEENIAKTIGTTSVTCISHHGYLKQILGHEPVNPQDENLIFVENNGCGLCLTGISPINQL